MDHGGYSNKLRGKHKVSTYKFPWKTDKLGVDKRKFNSCVRGHPWALEKMFVSRTVHLWELLPWADNRRKIEMISNGRKLCPTLFYIKGMDSFLSCRQKEIWHNQSHLFCFSKVIFLHGVSAYELKVKIKFSLLKVSASAHVNVYIQEMFDWEAKTGIEKIVCKQNCCPLPQCLLAESLLYFKTF